LAGRKHGSQIKGRVIEIGGATSLIEAVLSNVRVLSTRRRVPVGATALSRLLAGSENLGFAFFVALARGQSNQGSHPVAKSGRQDSNSKPAAHNQTLTTRDSQSAKIFDSDLQWVINAWRDLPTNLKAAVMAIVDPNSVSHRQSSGRNISEV
jgi:hypothetical protein